MPLNTIVTLLEIATPIAEVVPAVGTPLKGALEVLGKILKFAQEVKTNKEKTKDLSEKATERMSMLVNKVDEMKNEGLQVERLRIDIENMRSILQEIETSMKSRIDQNWLQRVRHKADIAEELDKMEKKLKDAFDTFMATSQIRIQAAVSTLLSDADRELLKKLDPVDAARYSSDDSPTGCLENTRIEVMKTLLAWARQETGTIVVYWLAGLAGTGKSTIAKTLCSELAKDKGLYLCTFFASKNFSERREPKRILHSFVYQLAYVHSSFRSGVLAALRSPPDVKTCSLEEQVKRLLAEPLRDSRSRSSAAQPVVLAVDALDECLKIDDVEGGTLIPELVRALNGLPVKLFVTSRMEPSLKRMFAFIPKHTLALHEIDKMDVLADVHRILETGFAAIRMDFGLKDWPTESDITELACRTNHFFILATTALKYIGHKRAAQPQARLKYILNQNAAQGSASLPYAQLDVLYRSILSAAVEDVDVQLRGRLGKLLGAIMLVCEPLSTSALARLIDVNQQEVQADVDALAAVLLTDSRGPYQMPKPVRIFHPSFRDFLLSRCEEPWFSVSVREHHQMLVGTCLDVIMSHSEGGLPYNRDRSETPVVLIYAPYSDVYPRSLESRDSVADASELDTGNCESVVSPSNSASLNSVVYPSHSRSRESVDHVDPDSEDNDSSSSESREESSPTAFGYATRQWSLHVCLAETLPGPILSTLHTFVWDHLIRACFLDPVPPYNLFESLKLLPQVMLILTEGTSAERLSDSESSQQSLLQILRQCRNRSQLSTFDNPITMFHRSLATACLLELNTHLHRNMCNISDPSLANSDIMDPDISTRLQGIITESVRYACVFWPLHIHFADDSEDLRTEFDIFVTQHISHWMETLSLLGQLSHVTDTWYRLHAMDSQLLARTTKYPHHIERLKRILHDVSQITQTYGSLLCTHSLHLYYSVALAYDLSFDQSTLPRLISRKVESKGVLAGHADTIVGATFVNKGSHVISVGKYGTIWRWSVSTGEGEMIHDHLPELDMVSFSADGTQVVIGTTINKGPSLWSTQNQSNQAVCMWPSASKWLDHVAFTKDDAVLLFGKNILDKDQVQVWDADDSGSRTVATLNGSEDLSTKIFAVASLPNGKSIVFGKASESDLVIWDASSGQKVVTFGATENLASAAISLDGAKVASGSWEGKIQLWDVTSAKCTELCNTDSWVHSLAFSSNGQMLAAACSHQIWLVDLDTQSVLGVMSITDVHDNSLSLVFSPDGTKLLVIYSDIMQLWDMRTCLPIDFHTGHIDHVFNLAFSPDGYHIASTSWDETICIWSSITGAQVARIPFTCDFNCVDHVGFTDDSKSVAAYGHVQDDARMEMIMKWVVKDYATEYDELETTQETRISTIVEPSLEIESESIQLDEITGWVNYHGPDMEVGLHLCWLPYYMRGDAQSSHGPVFAVGTSNGAVHIIDFNRTFRMFRDIGKL